MKSKLFQGIMGTVLVSFIITAFCSLGYGAINETKCSVNGISLPPNTPMLNTSLTTGLLLVQFSDWQTNLDARGSVGYVGGGYPDELIYNKYRYINYWDLLFSSNQYTGTAHPDYEDYYDYPLYYNNGNHLTVYGSLHDYYETVSYGNLNIVAGATRSGQSGIVNQSDGNGVITWITLSHTKGYYLSTYGQSASAVIAIANDAIAEAQQMYQSGQLDVNINSFQRLIILFAGAHLYGVSTIGTYNSGNSWWVIDAEKYGDDSNPITCTFRYLEVIAHEFGHTLGFPDLHGVYENTYGVGHYSLMGRNDPLIRMSPPVLDPYDQLQKGWLGYIMVNSPNYNPLSNQYLPPVEATYNGGSPFVAVIPISGTPGQNGNWSQGEYFIVENRRVENFDRFLNVGDGSFQGGFLIWHWSTNTTLQNGLSLEVDEADGKFDMAKSFSAGAGNYGTPSDFWPGTTTNDVFSPWSTPNSDFGINGAATDVGAQVRSYDVNTGSYNIDLYYAGIVNASPSKPQNLRITNTSATPINLAWDANGEPDISGYEVWRNDVTVQTGWQLLTTTQSTSYTDNDYIWTPGIGNDLVEYKIRAKDTQSKLSDYSNMVSNQAEPNGGSAKKAPGTFTSKPKPIEFSLGQNYPNPFNPTTEISFALPKDSYVKLVVYDMLGREVARLADGQMAAGYHAITWNASEVASGVYIYRFSAGSFVQVKRMLLLK